MKQIKPDDLIPLNAFCDIAPITIDIAYAQANHPHNMFEQLYHPQAKTLWAHKDFAPVILRAAQLAEQRHGWHMKLHDTLRPIEAQKAMERFNIHPGLLSKPGAGAHPRGMAVDVQPFDPASGQDIDMGTPFDYLVDDPVNSPNPAARDYADLSINILHDRKNLENSFLDAAAEFDYPLWLLPQEWWDFRAEKKYFDGYAPLSEADLYPFQRMISLEESDNKYTPAIQAHILFLQNKLKNPI